MLRFKFKIIKNSKMWKCQINSDIDNNIYYSLVENKKIILFESFTLVEDRIIKFRKIFNDNRKDLEIQLFGDLYEI